MRSKDANCTNEVKSRIAIGMATMVKLVRVWKNKSVSNGTKVRLIEALVLRSPDVEEAGGKNAFKHLITSASER